MAVIAAAAVLGSLGWQGTLWRWPTIDQLDLNLPTCASVPCAIYGSGFLVPTDLSGSI